MDQSLIQTILLKKSVELFVLYLALGAMVVATQNWIVRKDEARRWPFWRVALAGIPLVLVLVLAALLTAPRLVVAPSWTELRSEEGGFTVRLPGEPQEFSDEVPLDDTGEEFASARVYRVQGDWRTVSYLAQYMDYPGDERRFRGKETETLNDIAATTATRMGQKIKFAELIKLGPHQGIEFTYNSPQGVGIIQTRAYIVGTRIYLLWAGPLKNANDPRGMEFFASFTLDGQGGAPDVE